MPQFTVILKPDPDGHRPQNQYVEADSFDIGPSGNLSFLQFEELKSGRVNHSEELTHLVCAFSHGAWDEVHPGMR